MFLLNNCPVALGYQLTDSVCYCAEIASIAFIPLNNSLKPDRFTPFTARFRFDADPSYKPKVPEYGMGDWYMHKVKDRKANVTGYDPDMLRDLFIDWWGILKLKKNKRLMLFTINADEIIPKIKEWLGYRTYCELIHPRHRDINQYYAAEADKAWRNNEQPEHPIDNYRNMLIDAGIQRPDTRNATNNAITISQLFHHYMVTAP